MSGTDIAGLLDMLCLSQYTAVLKGSSYSTVESLTADDGWTKLIKKTQDRSVLQGYLTLRRGKDPAEVLATEKRMSSFQTVKTALMKLQDLQLKKTILEQGSTVASRSETLRSQIEDLLDEIDEAKAVLKSAQSEIEVKAPQREKKTRPSSAKPRSPRLANEKPAPPTVPDLPEESGGCFPNISRPATASSGRPPSRDVGAGWNRNKPIGRGSFVSQRLAETQLRADKRNRHVDSLDLVVRGVRTNGIALGVEMERDNFAQMCCGASRAGL